MVELAELAMEETGFGVFEDKVIRYGLRSWEPSNEPAAKAMSLGRRVRLGLESLFPVSHKETRRLASAGCLFVC